MTNVGLNSIDRFEGFFSVFEFFSEIISISQYRQNLVVSHFLKSKTNVTKIVHADYYLGMKIR